MRQISASAPRSSLLPLAVACGVFLASIGCGDGPADTRPDAGALPDSGGPDVPPLPPECIEDEPRGDSADDVPCDFDFSTAAEGQTLRIVCDHDLEGGTVTLPSGVTLQFGGGSLGNGTIELPGGRIDGPLLRFGLEVTAEGAALSDPIYCFRPERWGVEEGEATNETARLNRDRFNIALTTSRGLGAEQFVIDEFDAYFDVHTQEPQSGIRRNGLLLPSGIHLRMSPEVHLRVQPNGNPEYALLVFEVVDDVRVTGGNLWGDRFEHEYREVDPLPTHEFGFGLYIVGSHRIHVEGTAVRAFTGDAVLVRAVRRREDDGSLVDGNRASEDVTLRRCIFDESRRNNVSIVDGEGVVVEGCTISNAGSGGLGASGVSSAGTAPMANIDIEPVREITASGDILEHAVVNDVRIIGNTFIGAELNDITYRGCDNVEIADNSFTAYVANIGTFDISILGNTFENDDYEQNAFAISIAGLIRADGTRYSRDHRVYDNTIRGYRNGINVGAADGQIYDNEIIDCKTGIFLTSGAGNVIERNVIRSTVDESVGHANFVLGSEILDTVVRDDVVDVQGFSMLLTLANAELPSGDVELRFENVSWTGGRAPEIRGSRNIRVVGGSHADVVIDDACINVEASPD